MVMGDLEEKEANKRYYQVSYHCGYLKFKAAGELHESHFRGYYQRGKESEALTH